MNLKKIVWAFVILCGLLSYKKVKAGNDVTPRFIRDLITRMKGEMEKNSDNFPLLISETEQITLTSSNPASTAVLHSMLAQMYASYYNARAWQINRLTPLAGYVPGDMQAWTSNIFQDTIRAHIRKSLADAPLLQKTNVAAYQAILEPGKDSPALRPTLFDFLSYRGISILESINNESVNTGEIKSIYQNLIAFRKTAGNPEALLLAELDCLRYTFDLTRTQDAKRTYRAALDSLQRQYASYDFSVEIAIARLHLLQTGPFSEQKQDSINAAIYRLCKETIRKYPDYPRIGEIENRLNALVEPSFSSESEATVYPGKELKIRLRYKNLSSIKVTLYTCKLSPDNYANNLYISSKNDTIAGAKINEFRFSLNVAEPYTAQDTTIAIPVGPFGAYLYEISSAAQAKPVKKIVSVSKLFAVSRNMQDGVSTILVTDYGTGKPVEGVQVVLYSATGAQNKIVREKALFTGKDGFVQVNDPQNKLSHFRVIKGKDAFTYLSYLPGKWWRPDSDSEKEPRVALFSDRSVYRPGQTVFFKGIAYSGNLENPHVVPGKTYPVSLRDANNQEIARLTFTTDAYGSFNGRFSLPQSVLTGYFTIAAGNNGTTSFRVEEYKRPTFEVEFAPVKEEVRLGERLFLHGSARTFSGAGLEGALVKYRIVRRPLWPRFGIYSGNTQVAEGNATVGANGLFTVAFTPEKAEEDADAPNLFYRYEVIALVTNNAGETQEGNAFFSVGDKSFVLASNIASGKWNKAESKPFIISARNLNNEEVTVQGKYSLYLLQDTKEYASEVNISKLPVVRQVSEGTFTAGQPVGDRIFASFPSGRYRLVMEAPDSRQRMVTVSEEFILYSPADRQPPVQTHTWLVPVKTTVLPGETAEIVFGTSDLHAYVIYEIINGGEILTREIVELNNENKTFRIPFTQAFGNGVDVSFTFVKEGKVYNEQTSLLKRYPDRSLTIRPQTFRDRLRPGQKETWSFRVTDADSLPVIAQVLAGMYDAALDKIAPHAWYFNPIRIFVPRQYYFTPGQAFGTANGYTSVPVHRITVPEFQYDALNWQGVLSGQVPSNQIFTMRAAGVQSKAATYVAEDSAVADIVAEEEAAPRQVASEEEMAAVQLRQNFDETAFFYPDLLTDKEGAVRMEFTLPESNTTWKFMALAYTEDLKHGSLTEEVVSQKELMVSPNLPRFLRQGDRVTLSTQIINLSDKTVSGEVRLELFNPANNERLENSSFDARPFIIKERQNGEASWNFVVPADMELIGCRIVAVTPEASDGEQHLLPVLPDEIAVTESKPFVLPEAGSKTIRTGWSVGKTLRPFSMTLEVAGNPVWYAVQALPSVTLPQNEDAVSWFAAYYTNTLAVYMARSYPKVRRMIEQWEKQGGDSETLYSNLQKNRELKDILLEETPWVLAAQNETEQKQQLALLFNSNHAADLQRQALDKLNALQGADGGWSWYKGMPGSRAITAYILNGMSQLTLLGAVEFGEREKRMQISALQFLDKTIREEYNGAKNGRGKTQNVALNPGILEFLFVRSNYRDIPEAGDAREAIRFYTGLAEKNWNEQSLYGKALIAQLMQRNGKKETAQAIIASLRKIATRSENEGMYWANNRHFNNFFISPVSVHCRLMDAFEEISPDKQEIAAMKQWLLMQKQTQRWESVPATVNAIYTLLSTGSDWLADNGNCIVTWGNRRFETAAGEAGMGYIQEIVRGNEITPALQTVTVQKTGDGPAWGAIYQQYFEKADRIKAAGGELNVEKKLFVNVTGTRGPELHPVTTATPLKTGDKVTVRLIINAAREMDFVQLKDMRAGCFEPVNQVSGNRMQNGLVFYEAPEDVSQNFFFNRLPQGMYVMEYSVYVVRPGEYSGGISTIQCLYAPEFVAHTEGDRLTVK